VAIICQDTPPVATEDPGLSERSRTVLTAIDKRTITRLRRYYRWRGYSSINVSEHDGTDLTLIHHKLIENQPQKHGTLTALTNLGEQVLAMAMQDDVARRKPHNDFAARLSAWLVAQGRVTWQNVEFIIDTGPSNKREVMRPDVFSLKATYNKTRLSPVVHEVKVSRTDFLADIAKSEKRERYLLIANYIVYAAPIGVIPQKKLPDGCGLLEETDVASGIFHVVCRAKYHKDRTAFTPRQWMNLILKEHTTPSLMGN